MEASREILGFSAKVRYRGRRRLQLRSQTENCVSASGPTGSIVRVCVHASRRER